jgi:hypothetical protein
MTTSNDERDVPASAPTAVEAAVRPDAGRAKDPTAVERQRRRRAKLRANRALAPLKRDNPAAVTVKPSQPVAMRYASVTATVTQTVTDSVTPRVTAQRRKSQRLQAFTDAVTVTPVTVGASRPTVIDASRVTVLRPKPVTRRRIAPVLAAVLFVLAVAIGGVGICINAWFAESLGRTPEAARLFLALGVCVDGLALMLPTVASRLADARHYLGALVAWVLWSATMVFALLASAGFAGLNISDVTAGRAREALTGQALAARIETLQTERKAITQTRSVTALEAELQAVQPTAATVWKQTNGCRDVTVPASGQACTAVLQARARVSEAQRRDVIDDELRDAEVRLAAAPAISSADPQAATAAKLISFVTLGSLAPDVDGIGTLRILLLTLLPQCGGLVLMLAGLAWKGHSDYRD